MGKGQCKGKYDYCRKLWDMRHRGRGAEIEIPSSASRKAAEDRIRRSVLLTPGILIVRFAKVCVGCDIAHYVFYHFLGLAVEVGLRVDDLHHFDVVIAGRHHRNIRVDIEHLRV